MRWLRVAVVVAALGLIAQVGEARVPAFARQTGLTCNQCHMSITPAMDFTFTGMKFRMNGYRLPWVAEKIEAGEEGAVNGNRLLLGLGSMFSAHARTTIFAGSTAASDPALPANSPGPISSDLLQSLGFHYAGPMGEHMGSFNEFYVANGGSGKSNANFWGDGHYQIVFTANPGQGNILGWSMGRNTTGVHDFFTSLGSVAPSNMEHVAGADGTTAPVVNMYVYTFLQDRLGVQLGIEPETDNLTGQQNTYKRMNYGAKFGVFARNTDAGWVLLNANFKAGNAMLPSISGIAFNADRTIKGPTDAVLGVSATRASGVPYTSSDLGDAFRSLYEIQYGFVDKGPHSVTSNLSFSSEHESFSDGSKTSLTGWGFTGRYYYERTYGLQLTFSNYIKYDFTTYDGVVHPIPSNVSYTIETVYRMAQNIAFWVSYGNSEPLVLDQKWRTGDNWQLSVQYLW